MMRLLGRSPFLTTRCSQPSWRSVPVHLGDNPRLYPATNRTLQPDSSHFLTPTQHRSSFSRQPPCLQQLDNVPVCKSHPIVQQQHEQWCGNCQAGAWGCQTGHGTASQPRWHHQTQSNQREKYWNWSNSRAFLIFHQPQYWMRVGEHPINGSWPQQPGAGLWRWRSESMPDRWSHGSQRPAPCTLLGQGSVHDLHHWGELASWLRTPIVRLHPPPSPPCS